MNVIDDIAGAIDDLDNNLAALAALPGQIANQFRNLVRQIMQLISNNIPNNISLSGQSPTGDESEVYFGRGPSLLIADAADLSLEVLENVAYTNSSGSLESGVDLDTVLVKAMLLTDIALRHDSAWAVLEGVQWGNGSTT